MLDKSTSLDHVMLEESAKMFSSFAVNQSLKEKGHMQATNEIIATSTEKELSAAETGALQSFIEQTGIDADATGVQEPARALTKKQKKAAKYAQKNMMRHIKDYQRRGQANHIMSKLFEHSIRTPEQARRVHAHDEAKKELYSLLGNRQADAFFSAKADTLAHDFFPKVTVEANPKLMTAATGESRTLSQIFEYFIYKHFMILTEKTNAEVTEPLDTTVDWSAIGDVPKYIPYESAPNEEVSSEAPQAEETSEEVPAAPVP